jgi:hypothetical protein
LAGLARCARAGERLDQAGQLVQEVWYYLCTEGTGGMEMPAAVYGTVIDIFAARQQANDARLAVEMGYCELMRQADKIGDARWRECFLQNIPENRALIKRWQEFNNRT